MVGPACRALRRPRMSPDAQYDPLDLEPAPPMSNGRASATAATTAAATFGKLPAKGAAAHLEGLTTEQAGAG